MIKRKRVRNSIVSRINLFIRKSVDSEYAITKWLHNGYYLQKRCVRSISHLMILSRDPMIDCNLSEGSFPQIRESRINARWSPQCIRFNTLRTFPSRWICHNPCRFCNGWNVYHSFIGDKCAYSTSARFRFRWFWLRIHRTRWTAPCWAVWFWRIRCRGCGTLWHG